MTNFADNSSVVLDDATWNRPRSLAELRSFITARDEALDVEGFEF